LCVEARGLRPVAFNGVVRGGFLGRPKRGAPVEPLAGLDVGQSALQDCRSAIGVGADDESVHVGRHSSISFHLSFLDRSVVGVGREIGGGLDIRCSSAPRLGSVSQFAAVCPAPGHKCRGHGDGHWTCHRTGTSRLQTGESLLFLTLVNAAKRRAAFHGQRLPEWNRVCIGGDEQARGVRSVAPCVIDAADDRRVTRVHQHLVDVGDEVDLATHAHAAVQRVGAV